MKKIFILAHGCVVGVMGRLSTVSEGTKKIFNNFKFSCSPGNSLLQSDAIDAITDIYNSSNWLNKCSITSLYDLKNALRGIFHELKCDIKITADAENTASEKLDQIIELFSKSVKAFNFIKLVVIDKMCEISDYNREVIKDMFIEPIKHDLKVLHEKFLDIYKNSETKQSKINQLNEIDFAELEETIKNLVSSFNTSDDDVILDVQIENCAATNDKTYTQLTSSPYGFSDEGEYQNNGIKFRKLEKEETTVIILDEEKNVSLFGMDYESLINTFNPNDGIIYVGVCLDIVTSTYT